MNWLPVNSFKANHLRKLQVTNPWLTLWLSPVEQQCHPQRIDCYHPEGLKATTPKHKVLHNLEMCKSWKNKRQLQRYEEPLQSPCTASSDLQWVLNTSLGSVACYFLRPWALLHRKFQKFKLETLSVYNLCSATCSFSHFELWNWVWYF